MVLRGLIVGVFASQLAGCGDECTLVGCVNGATLRVIGFNEELVYEFHGVARLDDGTELDWDCPSATSGDEVLSVACDGNEVELSTNDGRYLVAATVVTESGRTAEVDLEPLLETVAPNGEDCGPVCRIAFATVHFP